MNQNEKERNARALQETGRKSHHLFTQPDHATEICKYSILLCLLILKGMACSRLVASRCFPDRNLFKDRSVVNREILYSSACPSPR